MLGSWYLWWCQLTCTSQNFLEVPNLIWAIVGLAGTSNDQVGPTSVQTLLRPVETWTRDLLGVSCDVWHQGGWVLWGCEVLELPGPNVSQQNIPLWGGLSMFLLSESVVYCCDSSVFISVVLPACFHCPKVAKESKMFRFWYESCKSHVSGLLLLEAQLYFCVWLSWRRWCVSLVFLFEVLQERLCADSQMKSSVVNKPPLHY